jgi:hypothetical protein
MTRLRKNQLDLPAAGCAAKPFRKNIYRRIAALRRRLRAQEPRVSRYTSSMVDWQAP